MDSIICGTSVWLTHTSIVIPLKVFADCLTSMSHVSRKLEKTEKVRLSQNNRKIAGMTL